MFNWNRIAADTRSIQQHDEVLELGAAVEEALIELAKTVTPGNRETTFTALASHNIIEEERDWFPLF